MMAPKNDDRKTTQNQNESKQEQQNNDADDSDIEEIEAVNDSLDSLSSALDLIEKRTDDIRAQLIELLNSNKEIRQSFMEQGSKGSRVS